MKSCSKNRWFHCGRTNRANFCPICGKSRPESIDEFVNVARDILTEVQVKVQRFEMMIQKRENQLPERLASESPTEVYWWKRVIEGNRRALIKQIRLRDVLEKLLLFYIEKRTAEPAVPTKLVDS